MSPVGKITVISLMCLTIILFVPLLSVSFTIPEVLAQLPPPPTVQMQCLDNSWGNEGPKPVPCDWIYCSQIGHYAPPDQCGSSNSGGGQNDGGSLQNSANNFDFGIALTGSNTITVLPSSDSSAMQSTSVSLILLSGNAQPVTLHVDSSGRFGQGQLEYNFNQDTGSPPFSTDVWLGAAADVPQGTYPIDIIASGGGVTHEVLVNMVVTNNAPPPPASYAGYVAGIGVAAVAGIGALKAMRKGPKPPPHNLDNKPLIYQEIEKLNLNPTAKNAAYQLKQKYPNIVFLSGARTLEQQALAMAHNIHQDQNYIKKTYKDQFVNKTLQDWVDTKVSKSSTEKQIADGLYDIIKDWSTELQLRMSKHLSGDAFDIAPVVKNANQVKDCINKLSGKSAFLDHEGKLERWHIQF